MPKKLFKRFMPDRDRIKKQKVLKIFGSLLYNPNLWCLNRRSAAGAFAIGLFIAFVPLPSQMILSAGLAVLCGVNLPISIALVWITNPITMPIIFYFAYKLGAWILHEPPQHFHFELSWHFLMEKIGTIAPPLFVGTTVCGALAALIGYFGILGLWRYSVVRSWQKRRTR
jgi:uncharacterized protein (DUF2062 family)